MIKFSYTFLSICVIFLVFWIVGNFIDYLNDKNVEDKATQSAFEHEFQVMRTGNMDTAVNGDFRQ